MRCCHQAGSWHLAPLWRNSPQARKFAAGQFVPLSAAPARTVDDWLCFVLFCLVLCNFPFEYQLHFIMWASLLLFAIFSFQFSVFGFQFSVLGFSVLHRVSAGLTPPSPIPQHKKSCRETSRCHNNKPRQRQQKFSLPFGFVEPCRVLTFAKKQQQKKQVEKNKATEKLVQRSPVPCLLSAVSCLQS